MPFTSWPTIWRLKRYRVAKYKQRRQIYTRAHLATLNHIIRGACAGLSYWWVQRHMRFPNEAPLARIASLNSDQAYTNHNYLAWAHNTMLAVDSRALTRAVVRASLNTNANAIVFTRETDFETFSRVIHHLDAHRGHHLLQMEIINVPPRHLCAIWCGQREMLFFDPNSGEYRVNRANRVAFFRNIVRQYATYVSADNVANRLRFREWDICYVG